MNASIKTVLAFLFAFVLAAGVAAIGVVWTGVYNIAATAQHLAPTYWVLDIAMRRSVKARSGAIEVPPLEDPALVREGLTLYRAHCTQCHGAPGIAPEPFALGMLPAPANLAHTGREWPAAELYWVVRHGIKMSGMPAWEFRLTERELWAVVALVRRLPYYSVPDYRAALEVAAAPSAAALEPVAAAPAAGWPADPVRGRTALLQYACITCHAIPGVVGASSPVGPPLAGMGARGFIAGVVPNTPEQMLRWLQSPHSIAPDSAMPSLGVSERDARDIAAYLGALR